MIKAVHSAFYFTITIFNHNHKAFNLIYTPTNYKFKQKRTMISYSLFFPS